MIKKALHRITVCWCLYGLIRLCIIVNPLLFKLWNIIFGEGDADIDNAEHIFIMWIVVIFVIAILVGASVAIHHFANWFFNTK